MPTVSFAQNAEDIVLLRVFAEKQAGFYIDVGAADPRADSVTKLFYDRGWSGVNIEPQKDHFADLARERPRDVNLHIGLSDSPGTVPFYRVPCVPGWSTVSKEMADWYRGMDKEVEIGEIEVLTLAEVCRRHTPGEIHFLKIDVEGHEARVLAGGDWDRYRPVVVVIEATKPEEWETFLTEVGYSQVLFDAVNRFYVAEEHSHLAPRLRSPANIVLDDFVPYVFYDQLVEAGSRIEDLRGRLDSAEALAAHCREHPFHNLACWSRSRAGQVIARRCRPLRRPPRLPGV